MGKRMRIKEEIGSRRQRRTRISDTNGWAGGVEQKQTH
jgi:hypothetical protein